MRTAKFVEERDYTIIRFEQLGRLPVVSGPDMAKILEVTEQRVRQLAKKGMPRVARGRYSLWGCMWWYGRYCREVARGRKRNKAKEYLKRLRNARWEVETKLLQLELEKLTGKFVEQELLQGRKYLIRNFERQLRYIPSDLGLKLGWSQKDIRAFEACFIEAREAFDRESADFVVSRKN